MDIRELKYFIALAEYKAFTKASEALHISQPSLSNSLKKLEDELGFKLIERSTRNFRLTKEGDIFYHEAVKLIHHYEHIIMGAKQLVTNGPSELSIGLIESSMLWMPEIIIALKREFLDVNIKLLEILSLSEVEKALLNFEIDIAITNQYINSKDIDIIPIYKEKFIVLLPEQHPRAHQPFISISELAEEDFIVCKEGFQSREDILNAFRQFGYRPKIKFEIERYETAAHLVERGLGVTIVPENYVKYAKQINYHAKLIKEIDIERTVYLAYENNRYLAERVWKLIRLIKEFFA